MPTQPEITNMALFCDFENIALGGGRIVVTADAKGASVAGLPDGIELVTEPRAPLTAATSDD